MILWHDQRGVGRLAKLTSDQQALIYRITGLPVSGNYGLSKTAWALERAHAVEGSLWLNIAEYLAARMSGERWSEPSLASRTMALDLTTRSWSDEVCELVGINSSVFPALRPASDGAPISASFASEVGLDASVTVHVAGHDHMVGAGGAALGPAELLNSTGTTEGLLFLRRTPKLDADAARAKLANGLACSGSDYTLFASIPTGGSAFATLQLMLGLDAGELSACVHELHTRYLEGRVNLGTVPLVLPQFRGSPPPSKNPLARGLISGLANDTTTDDIVLGCFLGLALQFRDVLELFETPAEQVKVIGPASGNPLWLQLKVDLLGAPLSAARFPEVVSRGAQALACDEVLRWTDSDPLEIGTDPERHNRLVQWGEAVRPRWEHLKACPA